MTSPAPARRAWQKPAHRLQSSFASFTEGAKARTDLTGATFESLSTDEEAGLALLRVRGDYPLEVRLYPPIVDDLHVACARAMEGKIVVATPADTSADGGDFSDSRKHSWMGPCDAAVFAGTDEGLVMFFKTDGLAKEYVRIDFAWPEVKALLDVLPDFRKQKLTRPFRAKTVVLPEPDEMRLVASAPGKEKDPRKRLAEEIKGSQSLSKDRIDTKLRRAGALNRTADVLFFALLTLLAVGAAVALLAK